MGSVTIKFVRLKRRIFVSYNFFKNSINFIAVLDNARY